MKPRWFAAAALLVGLASPLPTNVGWVDDPPYTPSRRRKRKLPMQARASRDLSSQSIISISSSWVATF
jgi:hypothetical protein